MKQYGWLYLQTNISLTRKLFIKYVVYLEVLSHHISLELPILFSCVCISAITPFLCSAIHLHKILSMITHCFPLILFSFIYSGSVHFLNYFISLCVLKFISCSRFPYNSLSTCSVRCIGCRHESILNKESENSIQEMMKRNVTGCELLRIQIDPDETEIIKPRK